MWAARSAAPTNGFSRGNYEIGEAIVCLSSSISLCLSSLYLSGNVDVMASDTPSPIKTPAGGCSIGCASIFVLFGVLFPFLHILAGSWEGEEMMLLPVFIGLPSFVIGHILAFVAILSKAVGARRAGKIALIIMWGIVALVTVVGIICDTFLRHP